MTEESTTITNTPLNDKYKDLYLCLVGAKGDFTMEKMKEIIAIVHRDFSNDKNNY